MPRLAKGELAPGIRLRSEASASSAEARFALMLALRERGNVSESEAAPFRTFEALCKHEDESKGIFPISPKTLRKHVASGFVGGAEAFHGVMKWIGSPTRQSAADAPTTETATALRTSAQTDAVLEMSARYADLIERVAKLAVESARARIEFQAHLKIFPESAGHLKLIK